MLLIVLVIFLSSLNLISKFNTVSFSVDVKDTNFKLSEDCLIISIISLMSFSLFLSLKVKVELIISVSRLFLFENRLLRYIKPIATKTPINVILI